jgi:DNA-binding response OmpR family regulator
MSRIVVAEPDPTGGPLLTHVLTAAGHEVRLVVDAIAAVAEAVAFPAEVLVLSTALAKGGPAEVVRQAKAAGIRPRVIGLIRHGDRQMALPEADAWLSWPLAPEDLCVVTGDRH